MYIQPIEFGLEGDIVEVVNFTVYGDGDNAADMLYELIVNYWLSNEWQSKDIKLPTKKDIINLIMNDEDLDDKEYYLSNIDTIFVDYNTLFEDKWFRYI